MTLKVGITGGIGTGKTAASKMFEYLYSMRIKRQNG